MQKYHSSIEPITQDLREAVNKNIVLDIQSKSNAIPKDAIFSFFTGKGKLPSGEKFNEHKSFHSYTEAKKAKELGQFFTPDGIIELMTSWCIIDNKSTILDPMSGVAGFANHLPRESNFTGVEVDSDNFLVAKHLYGNANIINSDIRYWKTNNKFDFILTNPAFGLNFDSDKSETFILKKSRTWLKDYGIFIAIVPQTYLQDSMYHKRSIEFINSNYKWLGQIKLNNKVFKNYNLNFPTKIIAFQQLPEQLPEQLVKCEFNNNFQDENELKSNIYSACILKEKYKLNVHRSTISNYSFKHGNLNDNNGFEYRVNKYFYELKTHPQLSEKLPKAVSLYNKFINQVQPNGMDFTEWNRIKLTENQILAHLKKYARNTNPNVKRACNVIIKKECKNQITPFDEIIPTIDVNKFVDNFQFISNGNVNNLYDKQANQVKLHLSKKASILNMEQGTGKTPSAYAISKYRLKYNNIKKIIVVAPSIAINTWKIHLTENNDKFIVLDKSHKLNSKVLFESDCGYILISSQMIGKRKSNVENKFRKDFKNQLKMIRQNYQLIFDECHILKNHKSQISKVSMVLFNKANYKLLMTGTMVCNNLSELYMQFQLLYNNSNNFKTFAKYSYAFDKNNKLIETLNGNYGKRFKHYGGFALFKSLYSPSKTTVFGINKQEQNIYNFLDLKRVLTYTKTTKTFKEMVGDKYKVHHLQVNPSTEERFLQKKIMTEFDSLKYNYFNKLDNDKVDGYLKINRQIQLLIRSCSMPQNFKEYTGGDINSKKDFIVKKIMTEFDSLKYNYSNKLDNDKVDGYLKIIRQIQLLIRSCSMPQNFKEYTGGDINSKKDFIVKKIKDINELVAIGTTSIAAAQYYKNIFEKNNDRDVFYITGSITMKKRQQIIDDFQNSGNGILIATQQSLSSSLNIEKCNHVFCESMQWNIATMSQFYFRFIRFTSIHFTNVYFVTYKNTIEDNLICLLMTKQRLSILGQGNESTIQEISGEFDVQFDEQLQHTMYRDEDDNGKMQLNWGKQEIIS
jgi:hypothetical protein